MHELFRYLSEGLYLSASTLGEYLGDYYTESKLSNYLQTQGYATFEMIEGQGYVTSSYLDNNGYIMDSELEGILSSYLSEPDFSDYLSEGLGALSTFVSLDEMNEALGSYVSEDSLSTAMENYLAAYAETVFNAISQYINP